MAHEVFISYATPDRLVADAVCHALEEAGVRCWVAPRDVEPGRPYARCIMEAIESSSLMLLVFSQAANESDHIAREVELAARERKPLLPVRVAEVLPNKELVYFLGRAHWLDAFTPPVEQHFGALIAAVRRLVGKASSPAPTGPLISPESLPPLIPEPVRLTEPLEPAPLPSAPPPPPPLSSPVIVRAVEPEEHPSPPAKVPDTGAQSAPRRTWRTSPGIWGVGASVIALALFGAYRVFAPLPTAAITGRIVTASGAPLAGADVLLNSATVNNRWIKPLTTTTNAKGFFTFEEVDGGRLRVDAKLKGFASQPLWLEAAVDRAVALPDIVMEPQAVVKGYVRSDSGLPLPGVEVVATRLTRKVEEQIFHSKADVSGHYDLLGLPAGEWRIQAFGDPGVAVVVNLAIGEIRLLDLQPSMAEISGRLLNAEGAPMLGLIIVTCMAENRSWIGQYEEVTAWSEDTGRFRLRLPQGKYTLVAVGLAPFCGLTSITQVEGGMRDLSLVMTGFDSAQTRAVSLFEQAARIQGKAGDKGSQGRSFYQQAWCIEPDHIIYFDGSQRADAVSIERNGRRLYELQSQRYLELLEKDQEEEAKKRAELRERTDALATRRIPHLVESQRLDDWIARIEAWQTEVNAWFARVDAMSKEEGPAYDAYLAAFHEYKAEENRYNTDREALGAAIRSWNAATEQRSADTLALKEDEAALEAWAEAKQNAIKESLGWETLTSQAEAMIDLATADTWSRAADLFEKAARLLGEAGVQANQSASIYQQAWCLRPDNCSSGDWDRAGALFESAARIQSEIGDKPGRAASLEQLATCLLPSTNPAGDWERAGAWFADAARNYDLAKDGVGRGVCLHQQAFCMIQGKSVRMTDQARKLFTESAQVLRQAGHEDLAAISLSWITPP